MIERFEWDSEKNEKNIQKHGISFYDAIEIFEKRYFNYQSWRNGEERMVSVGKMRNKIIAVIHTMRGENTRIISARIARNNERHLYTQHLTIY